MASPRSATTRGGGRSGRDGASPPPAVVSGSEDALRQGDVLSPLIRPLGSMLVKGVTPDIVLAARRLAAY